MSAAPARGAEPSDRLDKWLWHARFFRTRSLAADAARDGKIRVNGVRVEKPGASVRPGDVLTIARAGHVIVARVEGFSARRGSAQDAARLYSTIDAPSSSADEAP